MDGLFDSSWLKWAWGVAEAEAVKAELKAFGKDEAMQGLNSLACDYQPHRHGFALRVAALAETPAQIALRLSTVAHHWRSALDNAAWGMVIRGKRPPSTLDPRQRRAVQFPITETRDDFNNCLIDRPRRPSRLPGITVADSARVRRAQPYRHGKTNIPYHALAILATFNNTDKHRTLQPVRYVPETFAYEIADYRDCSITRTPKRGRRRVLEIGTEVAFFPVRRLGPDPYLHVKYQFATMPALHETLTLESWLAETARFLGLLLATFGPVPDEAVPMLEFVGALA